jgi:hypothetical protein
MVYWAYRAHLMVYWSTGQTQWCTGLQDLPNGVQGLQGLPDGVLGLYTEEEAGGEVLDVVHTGPMIRWHVLFTS